MGLLPGITYTYYQLLFLDKPLKVLKKALIKVIGACRKVSESTVAFIKKNSVSNRVTPSIWYVFINKIKVINFIISKSRLKVNNLIIFLVVLLRIPRFGYMVSVPIDIVIQIPVLFLKRL